MALGRGSTQDLSPSSPSVSSPRCCCWGVEEPRTSTPTTRNVKDHRTWNCKERSASTRDGKEPGTASVEVPWNRRLGEPFTWGWSLGEPSTWGWNLGEPSTWGWSLGEPSVCYLEEPYSTWNLRKP